VFNDLDYGEIENTMPETPGFFPTLPLVVIFYYNFRIFFFPYGMRILAEFAFFLLI